MGHLLDGPILGHAAYNGHYYQLFINRSVKPVARCIQNNPILLQELCTLISKNEDIAVEFLRRSASSKISPIC